MKPIKLTMTAFGPYAEETSVKFEDLDQGIYLISGDTGAGKTTIFDAIVFALFGKASGSNRQADMLHSDFVPKSKDTEVELEFQHAGRTYNVKRTIHYKKVQGTKDEYRPKPDINAVLKEEGRSPVEKSEAVTARIEELIGLDAEQFRKIVMLAQGEFRAFLEADNNVRGEILGKLFNNKKHQIFQSSLRAAEKQLREKREEFTTRIRFAAAPDSLRLPEEFTDEQRALFDADHPYLEENLLALVAADEARLKETEAEREKTQRETDALKEKRSVAAMHNQALDVLDNLRAEEKRLEERKQEHEERKSRADEAARALHQVRPVHMQHRESLARVSMIENRLNEISKEKIVLEAENERFSAEYEAAAADMPKIDALKMRIEQINQTLPEYDALDTARKDHAVIEGKLSAMQKTREDAENTRKDALLRLVEIDKEIAQLEGAEEKAAHLQNEYNDLLRRYREMKRLKESVREAVDMQRQAEQERAKFLAQAAVTKKSEERCHHLNEAFIANQAALLAVDLAAQIEAHGEGVCPVCGTHFDAQHQPAAPLHAAEAITKEQVEAAEKEKKAAMDKLSFMRENCAAMDAQAASMRENAMMLVHETELAKAEWAQISTEGFIADAEKKIVAQGKETNEKKARAEDDSKRLKLRRQERVQAQKNADDALEIKEKADQETTLLVQRKAALGAEIQERVSRLAYPAKNAAIEQLSACREELSQLTDRLNQATAKIEKARNALNTLHGEQKSLLQQRDNAKDEAQQAEHRLAEALCAAGFEDHSAYLKALAPIGENDAERWLLAQQEAVQKYEQDRLANARQIESQIKETQGYQRTDLSALEAELSAAAQKLEQCEEACTKTRSIFEKHSAVHGVVHGAKAKLRSTDKAYERLRKMADIASGIGADGGKWSFDKFAVGEFFRDILHAANEHLSVMSSGKYELVHQTKGERKNSAAGLNIEVYDGTTGQQRKTASLSGGESFQVSMALALGLSGTVQAHAGGRKVDSMFIDEGFGSLDDQTLESAIGVLDRLAGGERQIGIISHVAKLEECIPQKIIVKGGAKGSSLEIVR